MNLRKKILSHKIHRTFIIAFSLGLISVLVTAYSFNKLIVQSRSTSFLIKELTLKDQQIIDLQRDLNKFKNQLHTFLERTDNFYTSSIECHKNPDEEPEIWQFLPEEIRKKTYKKDIIGSSAATYDIYPLSWSRNCDKLAFNLELVGRNVEAYDDEDYKPRGIYILDTTTKKIEIVKFTPRDYTVTSSAFDSNFWTSDEKYVFVEVTNQTKNIWISKRYQYDSMTGQVKLAD